MSVETAVCYVADTNFLLGTLVSLRSFRQFIPPSVAEVFVFYLNPEPELMARIQPALLKYSATILPLRIDEQLDLSIKSWNKTHVPHSALGRFFLEPYLPSNIRRILYVDGDTLFVRDPIELLRFTPPDEGFAATDDISFYARNDWGKFGTRTRSYFAGLKIDGSRGYLNSGVLLANRNVWKAVTKEALEFFNHHSEQCKFHDQSAFNAVVGTRRVRLSPKWNFQTPFCYWNVREETQPCILHFTEYPKPWMGNIAPWGFLDTVFAEAISEFSLFGLPASTRSEQEIRNFNILRVERARRLAARMPVRLLSRRRTLRQLMRTAAI